MELVLGYNWTFDYFGNKEVVIENVNTCTSSGVLLYWRGTM